MKSIFVVVWKYYDGSGSEVIKAFSDENLARGLLSILKAHADLSKDYFITKSILDESPSLTS
jgi:hypothetical protein